MKSYKITLLPGDGIGPEITNVTHKILDLVSRKFGFEIKFKEGEYKCYFGENEIRKMFT